MRKRSLGLAALLWLVAAAANALPASITSTNGQLEFTNFQFFSPAHRVAESEVSVTALENGILLSGPVTADKGLRSFFVTYDVRAVGPAITGVSLRLASEIEQDANGLVLATKRILGGPLAHSGWDDHDPWKGKDPWKDEAQGRGRKDRGAWNHERDDFTDSRHDFGFGDRKTIAFLKTAQWQTGQGRGSNHPSLGLGNDGAIRLDEADFEAVQTLRVVEHVLVSGEHGSATWISSGNSFTVVPEPGTAALTLLGLCLLARRPRSIR